MEEVISQRIQWHKDSLNKNNFSTAQVQIQHVRKVW